MKNSGTNKFKKFFSENYKLLILFCGLTLLNIFFLCWSFGSNGLTIGTTFIVMLIGTIFLEIVLCAVLFIAKNKKWPIEKLFLVLGLIIGLFYVFALPPGRAPDEESHFARVYELSTGHFVSDVSEKGITGSMEASNISIINDYKEHNVVYTDIVNDLNIYPDNSEQSFIRTSAYSYNIISYFPHTIGMSLGNLLHFPLLVSTYLAKIFNLVCCILLLYFSIKYIPFLKSIIFLLTFLPISMQAMASLSPDGLVFTTATALISFILYSIYSLRQKFSKKHYILMFLICLFLSMGKIIYAPLCLLLFTIPKERFGGTKQKLIAIFTMGIVIFALLVLWLFIAPSLHSASDSSVQIATIMANPFRYLATVVQSLSVNAHMYITGFLGGFLEWFNVTLSPLYLIPTFIIFVLLCVKARDNYTITKNFKILSLVLFFLIVLATFTTMFIQWTKTGESIIDGVQGRYFLPLALIIPIAFLPIQKLSSKPVNFKLSQNYYLYGFLIFESIYAITTIACSHL